MLVAKQGQLDFSTSNLTIGDNVSIPPANLPIGQMGLPGTFKLMVNETPAHPTSGKVEPATSMKLCPVSGELCLTSISDSDLAKVHIHLSRCGAHTLENLLRTGHRIVDPEQIRRILDKCTCRGTVGRITHSKLTGRTSELCGEVVGIDVVYPFVDTAETRNDIRGGNFQANLIVGCLSRFAICTPIKDLGYLLSALH